MNSLTLEQREHIWRLCARMYHNSWTAPKAFRDNERAYRSECLRAAYQQVEAVFHYFNGKDIERQPLFWI